MKATSVICATTLAVVSVLPAHSKPTTLVKVYVGSDGLAHVVDSKRKDRAIPKEKNQVAVSAPKLAADKQTAGWLIEQSRKLLHILFNSYWPGYLSGRQEASAGRWSDDL